MWILKLLDMVSAFLEQLTYWEGKYESKQTPEAKADADIKKAENALVSNRIDDLNAMFDDVRDHKAPDNNIVK